MSRRIPKSPWWMMVIITVPFALAACALDRSGLLPDGAGAYGSAPATNSGPAVGGSTSGNQNGQGATGNMDSSGAMTGPMCGNGVVESGEACDDGNDEPDDGCDLACAIRFDCTSELANVIQIPFGAMAPIETIPGMQLNKSPAGACTQTTETGDEMFIVEPQHDGYLYITLEGQNDKLFYLLESCNGSAVKSCHEAAGDQPAATKLKVNKGERIHIVVEATTDPASTFDLHLELTGCGDSVVQKDNYEECDDGNNENDDGCDSACLIKCPAGWTLCAQTSHCYMREAINGTWDGAKSHCASLVYGGQQTKGYLATLTTSTEMKCAYDVTSPSTRTWIGATDSADEGIFAWVTGEAWTWPYKQSPPWKDDGEPNDSFGEDCVDLFDNVGGKSGFNDEDCDSKRAALCEWVPPGLPVTP